MWVRWAVVYMASAALLLAACAPAPVAQPTGPTPQPTRQPTAAAPQPVGQPQAAATQPVGQPQAAATQPVGPAAASRAELIQVTPELVKAAQAEGEVYLRYSAQQSQTTAMAAEFTKQYAVKVKLDRKVRAEGTELFATEERAGKHIVDVHVNTDRPGYLKLIKEGLYLNWTVPNLEQRFPKATYEPGYAVAPYSTRMVLSYNPDRLSTTDAEKLLGGTWTGLLDARFKGGRIGYVHPTSASQAVLWYWALSEDPNYGPAFLTKVATQNPVILNGSAAAREALAAGEVDLLIGDVEEPNMEGFEKGEKIRWLYPDLLPAYATVTHFISASAPHKNAAQLLVAWLLSDDGAVAISHAGRVPTHTSVTEDKRPQIEGLRKTDWWKPFPAQAMFSPSYAEQDAKYSDYERRSLATFNIR